MSQQDGFTGGFVTGVIFGSVIGGIVGVLAASRNKQGNINESEILLNSKQVKSPKLTEESIEIARLSLEDKIAQLNLAIDDVRQQLGTVNGKTKEREME